MLVYYFSDSDLLLILIFSLFFIIPSALSSMAVILNKSKDPHQYLKDLKKGRWFLFFLCIIIAVLKPFIPDLITSIHPIRTHGDLVIALFFRLLWILAWIYIVVTYIDNRINKVTERILKKVETED